MIINMNLIRKYLLFFVFLGLISPGYSQDNKEIIKLSISDAQAYALQNNRSVKSAKIDVQSTEKKVWETVAIGLPQLSLAANYQHQFVIPELSFGPYLDVNSLPANVFLTKDDISGAYKNSPPVSLGVRDNTTFDFTLSQLIFSGQYLVGLQAVKVFRKVSAKSLIKAEDQIKETVADSYYLVLVLGESIRVLNESLKSIDQTYNDVVKMNQQGFNEETDVDQININRSNIKRLITSTESQREISMNLLKYQLGMDFTQPLVLTDSISAIIDQGNIQYLASPSFKVENSIDYQLVNNQLELSTLNLKNEKSKYFPTVGAFYRRHEQTNQPAFNFAVKDLVGVTLNVPIFVSGQRSSKVSQAKFDLKKSQLNKENAEQGLIMEYESALSSYQTAYSNFTTNKESIILSKKIYDKTIIKYHEGVSTSFELAQNQNQYLTSEASYYTSILTLLNTKSKLDRILGRNN
jgi:outer membrane protein